MTGNKESSAITGTLVSLLGAVGAILLLFAVINGVAPLPTMSAVVAGAIGVFALLRRAPGARRWFVAGIGVGVVLYALWWLWVALSWEGD